MGPDSIEFLRQSNYIEKEPSIEALDDAITAWRYILEQETLTPQNVLQAHKRLMKTRDLEPQYKGSLRDIAVTVGTRACPPPFVVMARFPYVIESMNGMKSEEDIRRDHITFEHLHPFLDGNGRIGRILMNWQRVKNEYPILVINEEGRFDYYEWFKE